MSDVASWFVAKDGQQQGPLTQAQVLQMIQQGQLDSTAYAYEQSLGSWTPITRVAAFSGAFSAAPAPPTPPPAGPAPSTTVDEIDFEVHGEEMQYVVVTLDPGEAAIAEAGAFMYMDPDIEMQTIFGDGTEKDGGLWGKLKSAGKRLLVGESLFMTVFSNAGQARRDVSFAAPYPGKIIPVDLRKHEGVLICQKDAFLAAAKGISVGIAFQKKLGAGLFGGEGFILQKIEGQGQAFVHAGGSILSRQLEAGETLRVDTGCIVAFEQQVNYDIQFVGGVKTALFGGEGLFFATLTGPGKVWLQSLPFSRLAGRILSAMPQMGGSQGEGSILGGFGMGD
jgi:uncharacterized protein (TIGR00266 family)